MFYDRALDEEYRRRLKHERRPEKSDIQLQNTNPITSLSKKINISIKGGISFEDLEGDQDYPRYYPPMSPYAAILGSNFDDVR